LLIVCNTIGGNATAVREVPGHRRDWRKNFSAEVLLVKSIRLGHIGGMIKRHLLAALFLLFSFSLPAAETKLPSLTVGPVTYRHVVVLGANATDLYFTHDQGIGNVKLKYLSPELQREFHYDAHAAAEAERKQAEADALYQKTLAANMAAEAGAHSGKSGSTNSPANFADPISEKSLLGKSAPALTLEKWTGQKPATDGKYVLLTFWAPWSSASRQAIPEINALQKKFVARLAVIGVTTNSEVEIAELGKARPDFVSGIDEKGKLSSTAGVTSVPSVLLIDTKGIVRYEGHPAALTENKLQSLFSEPAKQ
jgi:cytochrome c biogenesis protein CcmG/thiol:disulfide interchange protein DsbE